MNFESGFLIHVLSRKKLKNTLGLGSFKRQTCSVEHQAHTIFGGQKGIHPAGPLCPLLLLQSAGSSGPEHQCKCNAPCDSSLPLTDKCLYLTQGKNK